MKRLLLAALAVLGISVAVVISGGVGGNSWKTFFPLEERNPVTHLRWNDDADEFRFALVSDRTGGHRADIFSQAIEKLNLMQPEFVLSVGDLIEGGKLTDEKFTATWKEFDSYANKLTMPFFYAAGNHDAGVKESAKFWEGKLGRRYYHFVYRNTLFLILNSDDPSVAISKEQIAYADKTLKDNPSVRWTFVIVHRPLWTINNGVKNGWAEIEKSLNGRPYTVFSGHVHRYEKFVRQGMNYYQFATTGGASKLRGIEYGEFDQFVWVTVKKSGPVLANIMLDAVYPENLEKFKTAEPGVSTAKRKATLPVRGFAYFEGSPMPGAIVTFSAGGGKGTNAVGVVEADGSFKLSTYTAFDGAPAGDYVISVNWREPNKGPSLIPAQYNSAAKSGLTATVQAGMKDVILELKR
jgi:hypothetical protein